MTRKPHLTARQFQTVQCVFEGMCDKEIAQVMGIEVRTVRHHKNILYRKFNISSRWIRSVRLVYLMSGGTA